MSRIQINDLNSSDFGFLSELTDEQMLGINGGLKKWLKRILRIAAVAAFIFTGNPIVITATGNGSSLSTIIHP
jgi:hypothetical protein